MKENKSFWILLSLTLITAIFAVISEKLYFSDFEYHFRAKRFNRILHEKERIMEDCLRDLEPIISKEEHHGSLSENKLFAIAEKNKITILEYLDDKLIYWSDNDFDVPRRLEDNTFNDSLVFLQNGWFIPRVIKAGNEIIVGLLRIRSEYGFENEIIKSGFENYFRLPENTGFTTDRKENGFPVFNTSGTWLFSLDFPEEKTNSLLIILPVALWMLLLILILTISTRMAKELSGRDYGIQGVLLSLIIGALLYAILLRSAVPEVIFRTGLFSPSLFSLNLFIPTPGHLVVLSILVSLNSLLIFRFIPNEKLIGEKGWSRIIVPVLMILAGLVLFCLIHLIFTHLVSDSNINFEAYRVLEINLYSVAAYTAVILLFLSPVIIILKGFAVIFPLLLKRTPKKFTIAILFSLLLGIYSLFVITSSSESKAIEKMKIQALSLSTDNDPEAEHLLLDLSPEISSDSLLKLMMNSEFFQDHFTSISDYVRETWFSGYWGNYNFSSYLCKSDDPLVMGGSGEVMENCFSFFNERLKRYGHRLTGTDFYFIDDQGGRSYYQGQLYFSQEDGSTNGLFIELYSDLNVFQPGYSELLLDKKFKGYHNLKDYSFAKYINGEMVFKSGDFPYDKTDIGYVEKNSDYRIFDLGKYRHLLYINGNATVILSKPLLTAGDILITFAYILAYTFIFINLMFLVSRKPGISSLMNLNFREKLQVSFIGILLFSFILIGAVVTYLTIREYRSKHYENITEKLNSIYLELDNKLGSERILTADWRNATNSSLNDLLINLSNIFNTDINLYSLDGFLLATSREEIFYRDLTARRLDNLAKISMEDLTRSLWSQTEEIGRMRYISVYVPFYNVDNKIIAYLNLPYFRMQSQVAREISNLVVAVINFTLLLVLITMAFAVFISGRLTSPLLMLGKGLASVELGKKSEHLSYSGNDEIGELVRQYNRMVDELDERAKKLADSEREYAWREMAKQIAHEIKNPLTPMKLNVQQLHKSWKDGAEGFGEKLDLFSRNQIEYIDNLSSIATAFSSFAKMPGTNPGEIDLIEQIKTTLELFRNTGNVTFTVSWPKEKSVIIYADREHLNGILSNLIKNSIQSIPSDRKGKIKVTTEVVRNRVLVSVEDNGAGIPEEIRNKMFTPNFTTKSSGTGLGLSIVKKYVEGANGRIWFESDSGRGTVFHIEFPLMYTVERPGETLNG